MKLWRRWRSRGRRDEELGEELRAHLAMAAGERMERGEGREEAERNARREMGNELLIREVTREMWGWSAVERLGRDLRYAARQMRRSPGFTATALATLALGLSATTMMFSIVNGVLLEPLGFREPERLYVARTVPPAGSAFAGDFPMNARQCQQWREHCRACEDTALAQYEELTLVGTGEPVKLGALGVSFNFFRTLGVGPALGRDFLRGEEGPGHFGEVILSDALWRGRFGGDVGIVGRTVELNGEAHTVVGVMPAGLHLPKGDEWGAYFGPAEAPQIFRPLGIDAAGERGAGNLNYTAVIRLRRGASEAGAAAEMNALLGDIERQYGLQTRIALAPLQKQVTRGSRAPLWLLLGMVATVLAIVCVNVGNLMVARTAGRYREAGVRMALGASRGQLFGLVLREALVLVAAGGIAGLAIAETGLKAFVAWAPVGLARLEEVRMDGRVWAFAGAAIAVSTMACGLMPAWRLAGIGVQDSLKAGAATEGAGRLRLREALVSVEVALSTVLLIAGGLLTMSFFRVLHADKGFDTAQIVTLDVSYLSPKYAHGARRRFVEETTEKLERIPGVRAAAAINQLPLRGDDWVGEIEDADGAPRPVEKAALANFRFVTPGYWQAMGIALKKGRLLDDGDKNRPRAVVSENAARYLWPDEDPIGRHVRGAGPGSPALEVVGVVGEVRTELEQKPPMMIYEHYWRMEPVGMTFVARTGGGAAGAAGVARAMRAVLAAQDPEMAIARPATMEQIVGESVAQRRFETMLAAGFAAAALALAALGIYGVIAYAVARRTPEIGIRVALGAGGREIAAMVLKEGMRPVAVGLAGGAAGALAASRVMASQLFGVEAWDPATMAGVAGVVVIVAAAASVIPARRAARVDPMAALRFE